MSDTYNAQINSDGSVAVTVCWDITGTSLPVCDVVNSTTYHLPANTDQPWTMDTAIAAITDQSTADKANWINAQLGTL